MTAPVVHIQALRKVYVVSQQEASAKAALRGLAHRQIIEVPAVDGISFDVAAGEIVDQVLPFTSDLHGSAEYRMNLARVVTAQAIAAIDV